MKTDRSAPPRRRPFTCFHFSIAGPLLLALAALAGPAAAPARAAAPQLAPVLNEQAPRAIPGQYIVVFKQPGARSVAVSAAPGGVAAAERIVAQYGGTIGFRYTAALLGFSARLPAPAVEALRAVPGVEWIEADQKVSLATVELNPPTGLDRTSERLLPLDHRYTYSQTGANVHAYVIDTGIRITHQEFGGRASGAFTAISDGNGTDDCVGHGTHVSGTIGGATYGIAKQVQLHAVRVLDCSGSGTASGVVMGVDWVTQNAIHPAVANMSIGGGQSAAIDAAVTGSIASGVTYAIAAGNDSADACTFSPADVPTAITVGAVDPTDDTVASFSNIGACVDLFAPGVNILSAWNTSDTATNTISGTSMATPHVTGVAALYLQTNPLATPAAVWQAIHNADDVATTPGWPGVVNPGSGSPNELLHWGSLNDGTNDGDPHLTTVSGTHYNFQGAGEFVYLRDGDGLEIQTRETPVATASLPGADPYDGLATCVSLNTAVAARVGTHRVTFEPRLNGVPDPNGLELRVDGVLTALTAQGLHLGAGAVVQPSSGGGVEIDFPDQTVLVVTPTWWAAESRWYLDVDVFRTPATAGIMGAVAPGNWLPALPDGTQLGAMPATLHQRFVTLNQTFGNAWRVTAAASLFDYAPGTSTATFTLSNWPPEDGACAIKGAPRVKPVDPAVAQRACRPVDGQAFADCVFDVTVTGEVGFAKTYQLTRQIRGGSTTTTVGDNRNPTRLGEPVVFTAIVVRNVASAGAVPVGTVQFNLDGAKAGEPVQLDANGAATWTTSTLKVGNHEVSAAYLPANDSGLFASSSLDERHTVAGPATGDCTEAVVVTGIPVPNLTCAQGAVAFAAGAITNFLLGSRCPPDAPLVSVFDISCRDAPILGFLRGSVYQATACCAPRRRP